MHALYAQAQIQNSGSLATYLHEECDDKLLSHEAVTRLAGQIEMIAEGVMKSYLHHRMLTAGVRPGPALDKIERNYLEENRIPMQAKLLCMMGAYDRKREFGFEGLQEELFSAVRKTNSAFNEVDIDGTPRGIFPIVKDTVATEVATVHFAVHDMARFVSLSPKEQDSMTQELKQDILRGMDEHGAHQEAISRRVVELFRARFPDIKPPEDFGPDKGPSFFV